jgi:integrase
MARKIERLSAVRVRTLKQPGYFNDGGNLYFRVAPGGTTGWIFRWSANGKTRDMGLGAYPQISLAAARKHAEECRALVQRGLDPIEQRRAQRGAQRVAEAKLLTFDDAVRLYIKDNESGWRSPKHRMQWGKTLADYASPVFGKLPVSAVDDGLVLRALKPIWNDKPDTASRVRGRIESVLNWARVHGYRTGENPARWKGHLDQVLPKKSEIRPAENFPAMHHRQVGAFMARLRERSDIAARCLEFLVLTAARSGEARGARFTEIDRDAAVWVIPPERHKTGKKTRLAHRVPLSPRALAIVEEMRACGGQYVFPGRSDRPLSTGALLMLLERMNRGDVTAHGFRATFRTWVSEETSFPTDVAEAALGHVNGTKVEQAYVRGTMFDKRRKLMEAWATYCANTGSGDVVPMRRRR